MNAFASRYYFPNPDKSFEGDARLCVCVCVFVGASATRKPLVDWC